MSGRNQSSGDRWLRIGIGAVLALLAVSVVYAVAIGILNMPQIGV